MQYPEEFMTCIGDVQCFTAKDGISGRMIRESEKGLVDTGFPQVTFAVVAFRNGEVFTASTTCRKGSVYNYKLACEKAKQKAMRKAYEHYRKQVIGTLI